VLKFPIDLHLNLEILIFDNFLLKIVMKNSKIDLNKYLISIARM